jgi:ribose transport system substrate-binding protein
MNLEHTAARRGRGMLGWRSAVIATVLVVGAAAVGCGSSDNSDSGNSAKAASATTASTADDTAAKDNAADAKPYAVKGKDADRPEVRLKGWVPNQKASKEYKIGYFSLTPLNTYVQAMNYSAETTGNALGVKVETMLADWDAQQQLNQIQTAIQQKKFDGIVVAAVDGDAECRMLSKTVPEAKIPIVIANFPICGDRDHTEGTVGVSASQSLPYYEQYTDWAFGEFAKEGGGKVAILSGPAQGALSKQMKVAVAAAQKKYAADGVKVVRNINADYTAEAGLRQAQTILQADPDIKMIVSTYDQNTLGAQKALAAAGKKPGDVQLYNLGGDHSTFPLMKQGWIQGMMYLEPLEEVGQAVEMLVAHLDGVEGLPTFNNLGEDKTTPAGTVQITKENFDKFAPEF